MTTAEILSQLKDHEGRDLGLAPGQLPTNERLLRHLLGKMAATDASLTKRGSSYAVWDADDCRAVPDEAGRLHAELIIGSYGPTYALPNKDPKSNAAAIQKGELDLYLLFVDGEAVGTACLVDTGDGFGELGRAASRGRVGNSLIQHLRIVHWLTDLASASRFHTLFTTLRSAPDRQIDDVEGTFTMAGGQAVSHQWAQFPELSVAGSAPLYLKHGVLEQFTCASISCHVPSTEPVFVLREFDYDFVRAWLKLYRIGAAIEQATELSDDGLRFVVHAPPHDSPLADLVHADVVATNGTGSPLTDILDGLSEQSPFVQVAVPVNRNSGRSQADLAKRGFQVFGFVAEDHSGSAALLYGRVRPRVGVVPTYWTSEGRPHPFWNDATLVSFASAVEAAWKS